MMAKGSAFERDICEQLSLWWTDGKRDDVFWRTSGSGARAKTRSKTKQDTFGQYGDVQATDPIGQPLMDLCSVELKRGYSKSTFADVIDKLDTAKEQVFESFVKQVTTDENLSGSFSWMLIIKRDRRKILVFIPQHLRRHLELIGCDFSKNSYTFLQFIKRHKKRYRSYYRIFGTSLTEFLEVVKPTHIKKVLTKCGI